MKSLRFLLLLVLGAVVAAVVTDYLDTREANLHIRVVPPDRIPANLNTQSGKWEWSQSVGGNRAIKIVAGAYRQANNSVGLELDDVELRIFHDDRNSFDLIQTAVALFDTQAELLHSDVDVFITLGIPSEASVDPSSHPTRVHGSGMTFESKTGICKTERHTEYEFEGGRGSSTGAYYDPSRHFFRMESKVFLEHFGAGPGRPTARVHAGRLTHYEDEQRLDFDGGVDLERGVEKLTAQRAVVHLDGSAARRVEAWKASGSNRQPARAVAYKSDHLEVLLNEDQSLEKVSGWGAAQLESLSAGSRIQAEGGRIDLNYRTAPDVTESLLQTVHLRDKARVEERPVSSKQVSARRLQADWIELQMAENGDDLKTLSTLSRGRLDLLPPPGSGVRRQLEADRIQGLYTTGNRIEHLRATGKVEIESVAGSDDRKRRTPPLETWSENFEGVFDPKTGSMRSVKQWSDFRFERGPRHGRATEALFKTASNEVELTGEAEVWDPSGTVSADLILLNENTGDYTARGSATSSFTESAPEKPGAESGSDLFAPGDPVFAGAEEIISKGKTGVLQLSGDARLWQAQDRLEADSIHILRAEKTLRAERNVVHYLREENTKTSPHSPPGSDLVQIKSAEMQYEENRHLARYRGSVEFRRSDLTVLSDHLEAHLSPGNQTEGSPSRLDKALASGDVTIRENRRRAGASRAAFGRTAEYLPGESKVVIEGDPARIQDGRRGATEGRQLTYYLDDDRLLVQGGPEERARTLRRKRP
jgi:lipopolysaccharide transport protein LptA